MWKFGQGIKFLKIENKAPNGLSDGPQNQQEYFTN